MRLLRTLLATLLFVATAERANAATATLRGTVVSGPANNLLAQQGATVTAYRVDFPQQGGGVYPGMPAGNPATTDGNGSFQIDVPLCDPNLCTSLFYAVATANGRPTVTLATIIGSTIDSNKNVIINEMTTVAAAYAFAQLFNKQGVIEGTKLPLGVAQGFAEELVPLATGAPSPVIANAPNANQTNTWQELGTLANILAHCVRNTDNACNDLFTLTGTNGQTGPVTTLQAFVNIARHPAVNVGPLFALSEGTTAYVPVYVPYLNRELNGPNASDLLRRLDAFTVAIKVNATQSPDTPDEQCPFSGPGNIAFDEQGYAWVTINTVLGTPGSANCQVVLKPNGQPSDGSNGRPKSPLFGGGLLGQGFGIGLDPHGHVWSGNFGWGRDVQHDLPHDANGKVAGSVSEFTLQGTPLSPDQTGFTGDVCRVQGVASDASGNIWMAGWGNDTVAVFPGGNQPAPDNPNFFDRESHSQPFGVAIDGAGAAWVTYEGRSTVSKFKLVNYSVKKQFEVPVSAPVPPPEHPPANPPANPCLSEQPSEPAPASVHPKGIAIDQHGNAWAVASAIDKVSAFDTNGNLLGSFGGGGIVRPWGVAVDSRDNIWVANFGGPLQLELKYGVSELCGVSHNGCSNTGEALSPATGYTLPSGGDQVRLHNGEPLYGSAVPLASYKPLMRITAVGIDVAGNIWALNNWKPESINDTLLGNPGGDGIVIFIGLAAPVMPVPYSAPPRAP